MTAQCPACDATGKHFPDPESDRYVLCPSCQGRGWFVPCFCCSDPIHGDERGCDLCSVYRTPGGIRCDTHSQFFPTEQEEP